MSMLLMVKAMQCKVGNPTRKLVLLKLADNANDNGVCFPSYQHIADQCEITRRSAISHIDALVEAGFVEKKERTTKDGNTSNLYILHLDQGSENSSPEGVKNLHHPSENISPPPSENISPRTSHSINQSVNHKKTTQKKSPTLELLAEFGITGQLAEDFITHRKAKTAPITRTALERLQKQADLAGLPLVEVAEVMIERGWRGFKADWDWNGTQVNKSNKPKFDDNDDSWWRGKTIEVRGY
ncbi:helix-turn-helix domain-containing protein [Gallibacterium salpingitidis]|uniref:helix-turn-helix domain-containing protein n=1 Tax=Gallibacterium salpingitidis TaxID=505341 RepID=UPI00266F49AD|nr:helix-turn-helix domain-containing protein [Gallibacterium salpingitidis]WKS98759.1 helix-turn-helix domain-containing protein [Gallibacterium salpingitidis]